MEKKESTRVTEAKIVKRFARIAFDPETKDSDRLRALDWLSEHLERKNGQQQTLKKLDQVLKELRGNCGAKGEK